MIFLKLCCEKKDLQVAVINVSRAASPKSPIPSLEGMKLETQPGGLKLTSYDTKIGIYTTIEADILESGKTVLPARFLVDLVRRLPDGMVTIETDDYMKTTVTCGRMGLQVMGYDPEDFPALNTVDEIHSLLIPEKLLKNMINQTIFAVSASETRPIYTGILFEVGATELTLVAVDGYRLAKRSEKKEDANMEPCTFVIPGTTLSDVEKLCSSDSEEMVKISLGEKYASFEIGKTVLISRRLEGEFMNYRKSIPANFRYEIVVEREELIRVIDRVSLVIKDKQSSPVKMTAENGVLEFDCTTIFGHAQDECLCDGNGDGLRIGFNDRYFMDALKAANEDKLKICMNTPSSPIIIEAAENGNYLYMVLPVRLREND